MTTPLAPGVYVKEVPSGVRSVIGAGTSTPAFLGNTATLNSIKTPTLVRSWTEFRSKFFPAPADAVSALSEVAEAFRTAKGKREQIQKIIEESTRGEDVGAVDASEKCTKAAEGALTFTTKAIRMEHDWGYSSSYTNTLQTAAETLIEKAKTVKPSHDDSGASLRSFQDALKKIYTDIKTKLTSDFKVDSGGFETAAQKVDEAIKALNEKLTPATAGIQRTNLDEVDNSMKGVASSFKDHLGIVSLTGIMDILLLAFKGYDIKWRLGEAVLGFFSNGGSSCYIVPVEIAGNPNNLDGDPEKNTGLSGLEKVHDVSIVAVPDLHLATTTTEAKASASALSAAISKVVEHCKKMGNRLAIIDPVPNLSAKDMRIFRDNLTFGSRADLATLYYPWIKVPGITGEPQMVPPSGHIAGVWAATDASRGVFKAPANVSLAGATDLATPLSDAEQGELNAAGVNCLRSFPGRPLTVWGARTLADPSDRDWKYVNVRRLVCFLSDSIHQSTSWAVFEPNDEQLWATLRQSVSAFLKDQWRLGALQGTTAGEAFHVVCDASNNPDFLIDQGEVHCDVYVAPVRPAEFVHFSIRQTAGQAA
ncbi:phage tail sheath family protein [Streptomyces noursei]|uniref:phage tail sheath family protein n=1 Tax=Streptomyces noursei TaxID=1971 RepID=UPI0015E0D2F8|nr:phage tail sheath subtilisin-like domain-containing protein [Streptomyces noursei]